MCNIAYYNTIFSCEDTFEAVASNLEEDMSIAISLFRNNQMAANPSKLQVILLGMKKKYCPLIWIFCGKDANHRRRLCGGLGGSSHPWAMLRGAQPSRKFFLSKILFL